MAPHPEVLLEERALSPMAIRDLSIAKTLVRRHETYKKLASAGSRPAVDLRGPGFQFLFAFIAVAMTFAALWFFLWAKNGGFKWRGKQDWEDYKSTVLRRKGPDGKTLSNATKSTRLGGGSVVHGGSYGAESSLGFTDETATSADTNEYRDAEEGKGGLDTTDMQAGLRGGAGSKPKSHRRDHINDYKDPELRNYRHEKAARVGGLNRTADGMYTDYSGSHIASDLGSNVSSRPLVAKGEKKDAKKEAKEKERRAKERMRNAKAAEKEATQAAAAKAKARKEAQKAEAKREKAEYKKKKRNQSEAVPRVPEMAEVARPLTDYQSECHTEYTRPYTDYTAPSEAPVRSAPRRSPPSAAYSFTTGDDTTTEYTGVYTNNSKIAAPPAAAPSSIGNPSDINESSYYSDYRPNADRSMYTSATNNNRRSRTTQNQDRQLRQSVSQPRARPAGPRPTSQSSKRQRGQPPSESPSDIFTAANGEATGHMSYPCHIPGLSQAGSVGASESVSQVGASSGGQRSRDVMDGYRRGGVRAVGRRDSLSDSDLD